MTESTTRSAQIPTQAGPPLADTSDMAQVHKVFRNAVADSPSLIGSAAALGPERVALVATYYENVLELLEAHHGGEDELLWPKLTARAVDQADEINRVANQHHDVTEALEAANARLAEWRTAADADSSAALAGAVAEVGAALLPHLDEEERFIVPLAAQYITAPEWGELPGHAMQHYSGNEMWLVIGLVREQMRPDQVAMMEAHMPPPVMDMMNGFGNQAFDEFMGRLRG